MNTREKIDFGQNQRDLIVLTYQPTKAVAAKVEKALRAGDAVAVEDRHNDTRWVWPAGTFNDNELLALFPGLRALRYEDVWARPDWTASGVNKRLVRKSLSRHRPRECNAMLGSFEAALRARRLAILARAVRSGHARREQVAAPEQPVRIEASFHCRHGTDGLFRPLKAQQMRLTLSQPVFGRHRTAHCDGRSC